jgi:hypothetical protein
MNTNAQRFHAAQLEAARREERRVLPGNRRALADFGGHCQVEWCALLFLNVGKIDGGTKSSRSQALGMLESA